jgi:hypothetical protein
VPQHETRGAAAFAHAALAATAALLLFAIGRPVFTDDAWWHLAFGRAYASAGPWLTADPILHTATGPPAPASWLSDVGMFAIERSLGFFGLRLIHVATAIAILAFAWDTLRRATRSPLAASLCTSTFLALASYRLFQLRPELATLLATLVLYRVLLADGALPSRARVAAAAMLCGVWANLHAGFLLGPILIAAAAGGVALSSLTQPDSQRPELRARALRLAAASGLALLATFINPAGSSAHVAYQRAGGEVSALARVVDEWTRFDPFALPVAGLPPAPLAWILVWGLLLATPLVAISRMRRGRSAGVDAVTADAALIGLAGASLVAMLLAVRFLWLGLFPLLLVAREGVDSRLFRTRLRQWLAAAACVALLPGFVRLGDWPFLSQGLAGLGPTYREPYAAFKYYAESAWFLRDAELTGNLYNAYFTGGFLGYWLAPQLRSFIDGSLNVPEEVMRAYGAIQQRASGEGDGDALELLDRYGVDLFVGVDLPSSQHPNRPWRYTTSHLERAENWMLVFRSLRSAVYLRRDERNRANLEKISDYYAEQGVPFDPVRGLDVEQVLREAPAWALRHGLVPRDFARLTRGGGGFGAVRARDRLAGLFAALGLYERAAELDLGALALDPGRVRVRRRLAWSLLRLDRAEDAASQGRRLRESARLDPLSQYVAEAAEEYAATDDVDRRAEIAALLPVFARGEALALASGLVPPEARVDRYRDIGPYDYHAGLAIARCGATPRSPQLLMGSVDAGARDR